MYCCSSYFISTVFLRAYWFPTYFLFAFSFILLAVAGNRCWSWRNASQCDIYLFIICTSCMIRLIVCYFNTMLPPATRGSPAPATAAHPKTVNAPPPTPAGRPRPPTPTAAHRLVPPLSHCPCYASVRRLSTLASFAVVELDVSFLVLVGFSCHGFCFLAFDSTQKKMISCEFVRWAHVLCYFIWQGNL